MSLNIDLLIGVVGAFCFLAGYSYCASKQKKPVTDEDLQRDLEYHRNLSNSLRQDVTDLRRKNNDLLEQNWQLTKKNK
jgi:hypothetical protein